MPNVLLVYPKFPSSYWGYNFALDFVGKKAAMPPLGLLTVAGIFPAISDRVPRTCSTLFNRP